MVSIRLGYEDLKGNDILAVTKSQAKKLAKGYENKKRYNDQNEFKTT